MCGGTDLRTILSVPISNRPRPDGSLYIDRLEVRAFTDKQIALVATFADQAVIAIENVRLFDEVQARAIANLCNSRPQRPKC